MVQDIPKFRLKRSKYRMNDLWNADEFGLIYYSTPKYIIVPSRIPGKKNLKQRLTFVSCANGDGFFSILES